MGVFQAGGQEGGGFRPAESATPTSTPVPTETPLPTETSLPTATLAPATATPTAAEVSNAAPAAATLAPETTAEATEPATGSDRYVSSQDAARFEELRDQALAGNSLFGPASGDLVEGAGVIQGIFPEIETTNFYARATFTNPQDLGVPYEVGFGIRHVEGNNQLRLTITTDDVWSLGIGDQPAYQTGKAYGFQSEADEQNTIELVADGETGYLAINGMVVAVLDLSPSLSSGDVWVAAGLNAPSIVSGRTSTVTDFQIWGLP